METWELAARESIRDLVARYNASGDAGRFEETLALFAFDAVVKIVGGRTYAGREEIRTLFTAAAESSAAKDPADAHASPSFIRHFTATHQIDLRGRERAAGRCYYAVLTGAGLDHWGRYVDSYVEANGQWQFAKRVVSVDGAVLGGWGDRAQQRLGRTD